MKRDALAPEAPKQPAASVSRPGASASARRGGPTPSASELAQLLAQAESRLRTLAMLSSDWYWEQDRQFRFTAVGGDRMRVAGLTDDVIGKAPWDLPYDNMTPADWLAHRTLLESALPFSNLELRRPDSRGAIRYLSISGHPVLGADGVLQGYRGIARDVTGERTAAARIARLHSLYDALRETDAATGRLRERVALCTEVAEIAVRHGQFRMAVIWMRQPGSSLAHSIACAGDVHPYVDALPLALDLGTDEAQGPTGIALLSGAPNFSNDLLEARIAPWHERDRQAGFRSCAAFPLRRQDQVDGALTLYADLPDCFDEQLLELLARMAENLSVALEGIEREAGRAAAEAALRESEARFRSLTALSSDWYWERDADLRFILHSSGNDAPASQFAEDFGRTRWELPVIGVTEAQWQAHRSTLQDHKPFRDFEFRRRFPGGRIRHISVSGEPTFDAARNFTGYRGIGRDITERKRAEQMEGLEHGVASILAATNDAATALRAVIRSVCETEDWDCGRYWRLDEKAGVLRCDQSWTIANPGIEAFLAGSRDKVFTPGFGLVGHVLQTGAPLWVPDIGKDPRAGHLSPAYRIGLRSVCLFPVLFEGKLIGVLAFISRDIREPDHRLLAAAAVIGSQIGQFLQRKVGETQLRDSEARYRTLTELSSDWYWEQDDQQRFTRSDNSSQQSGIAGRDIIGKTRWETGIRCDPEDRVQLEAQMARRQPFRDFEYCRIDSAGAEHYVLTSGAPMFDADGHFLGYRGVAKDITERKRRDLDLQRFRAAMDATADAIYLTDRAGTRFLDVNDGACRLLGYTRDELLATPPGSVFSIAHGYRQAADDALLGGATDVQEVEALHKRKDGTYVPVEVHRRAHRAGDDWIIVGVARDITARIESEHAIDAQNRNQGLIARFGQQALAMTDPQALLVQAMSVVVEGLRVEFCCIMQCGPVANALVLRVGTGWDAQWLGRRLPDAVAGTQAHYALSSGGPVVVDDYLAEFRFTPSPLILAHPVRGGVEVLIGSRLAPFGILGAYTREPNRISGESVHFLQSVANIVGTALERRNAEEKLAYLAQFDSLTGLPNRDLFRDRLTRTVAQAAQNGWLLGILYIDLDGFKVVNDTFGHDAGDRLLTLVAERLRGCVRNSDTVGRLGGDEFAIVLANMAGAGDAERIAQHVVAALVQPFKVEGRDTRMTASVGIAVYPGDGLNADALLKSADTAMYRAKEQGRNNFQFYTAEPNSRRTHHWQLEHELRAAIEQEQFELYYQPEISLDTRRIIGVEALIRWHHPERGLLGPDEFIETAEDAGMILAIERWVLETACTEAASWHRAGHDDVFVAVNVSPVEIQRGKVAEQVQRALSMSGLPAASLEIELTESVLLRGAEPFINVLIRLKALGVAIAIDDFGTGYSSLSYLKHFPIDKVKIDQSFIRDVATGPDDGAIVRAVIAMAHHLKLKVAAEGVETTEQSGFLLENRCDIGQGFLFGRPMSAAALRIVLDANAGRTVGAGVADATG